MKYKNEEQLMKKLGIESWKDLNNDKILEFAAMMPDMDKEVLLKVIEQFPELTKLGKVIMESLDESIDKLIKSNSESYDKTLDFVIETQSIIKEQLNNPDLSSEERKEFRQSLMQLVEMVKDMDSENKSFLKSLSMDKLKGVAILAASAIVLIGGKVTMSKSSGNKK